VVRYVKNHSLSISLVKSGQERASENLRGSRFRKDRSSGWPKICMCGRWIKGKSNKWEGCKCRVAGSKKVLPVRKAARVVSVCWGSSKTGMTFNNHGVKGDEKQRASEDDNIFLGKTWVSLYSREPQARTAVLPTTETLEKTFT